MIRREGRLDHPPRDRIPDSEAPHSANLAVHGWERALGVAALVGLLMFGAIVGVDQLMGLFPS